MTAAAASALPTTLLVDATERDQTRLALLSNGTVRQLTRPVRAQALPALIEELLGQGDVRLTDVQRWAVCNQPGSLTGTRIGVSVVNTLAWLLPRPIIECEEFTAAVKRLQTTKKPSTVIQATVANEVVYPLR